MSFFKDLFCGVRNMGDEGGTAFFAPATGEVSAISSCSDPVFAGGTMGQGFVLNPSSGVVASPIDGTVEMVFDTLHAFGLRSPDGCEVLVHVGIDTVELNGKPFRKCASKGDRVRHGDRIVEVDLAAVAAAGLSTEIVVVLPDTDDRLFSLDITGRVRRGARVGILRCE